MLQIRVQVVSGYTSTDVMPHCNRLMRQTNAKRITAILIYLISTVLTAYVACKPDRNTEADAIKEWPL